MNEALTLLCTLAKIPAPSNDEGLRAEFCCSWLKAQGAKNAYIDEAQNVILPIGDISQKIAVFMAHSDVVFPDKTELPLKIENGKIFCPGIGDDTAHIVCLLMAAKEIIQKNLTPRDCGVLLVINSGEEGLGNLRGCRQIMRDFGDRVFEFVTLDGAVPVLHKKPVGSKRMRVTVKTPGGHSYQDFGTDNAIACLSKIICDYYKITVPHGSKTTYNVGTVSGGTSVNTIAQSAQALFEFRSDEREGLSFMQAEFDKIIKKYKNQFDITVTVVGDRPCEGDVDRAALDALCLRAENAVKRVFNTEVQYIPGSTDCNVPSSMGIPSVCVGCVKTQGAHTREELMEIDSLEGGIEIARELICYHFGE